MKKEKKFTFSLWGRSFLTLSMLLVFFAGAFAQTKTITGKITDAKNEPLVGATVIVEGDPTNGVTADFDGNFSINVPQATTKLVISFIGYKPQTVSIEGKTNINVVLQEEAQMIDEVVVVGYGSQKKVNLTGAVGTVDAKVLESRPVQNVSQALQGVVPGLNFSVGNAGGQLDGEMSFNIRGAGSIGDGSSSSPLVLIDGMEGNMNSINPNDIESISVLKDASSSAIYGSRAAFGVILITTKSGKAGRTSVSYSGNVRFAKAIQVPEMMDSYHFAMFFNEAAKNDKQDPVFSPEVLNRIIAFRDGEDIPGTVPGTGNGSNDWQYYGGSNANTDWFKEQYKSWVPSHEHNISINGGTEKLTYLVSGNFLDQNGLIRHGGDDFQRYSLTGKINATLSDYVKLSYSSKWIREDFERPTYLTGLFYHNIARRWPTVPAKDPNGHYTGPSEIIQLEDGGRQKQQKDFVYQQVQLTIEPIKNWKIYAEGNLKTESTNLNWAVLPIYAYHVDDKPYLMSWDGRAAGASEAYEYNKKDNFLGLNLYTDYFKQLGDHYFKVMVGFNGEQMKRKVFDAMQDGLISANVPSLNTSTKNPRVSGSEGEWATAGFFGRINYNYKEKYLLEVNGRYDGTSRFVGSKRWGFFPSFSAGWNIAREGFWENWTSYVNTLKLRGSWGQLGNMNTEAWYPFYQSMPFNAASSAWLIDGKKPNTASAPGLVTQLMTWEKIESWDIGFDWGAFNNRFTGSFDYFKRTTKDMIGPAPQRPAILGTSVPKVNNSDMESYGFELELSWRDRIQEFSYGVKVVLSDDQQKITRYPNQTGDLSTYIKGQKKDVVYGYKTKGIAKTQAEMDAHLATLPNGGQSSQGTDWRDGDIMYMDLNHDGKIDKGSNTQNDPGDLIIVADQNPRYKYGITIDAAWKGIDFSVFFQGVGKRDYVLGGPYFWGAQGGMWQSAGFQSHWDFFREDGHELGANKNSYYPRPYFSTGKNQQVQTRYVQNASYIRMKNIQLGYTLPKKWTDAIRLQSVRVYVSGDNLWTKSDISGVFDPETLGGDWGEGKIYPLSKTISAGINVNF